jgi:hypothetical protein
MLRKILIDADYFLLEGLKKSLRNQTISYADSILTCTSSGLSNNIWVWNSKRTDPSLYQLDKGGKISVLKSGTYLIMAKVPGVSSSNNGYTELRLNNTTVSQVLLFNYPY